MATLNTLNKTISTTSQELTSTANKDSLLSNSRRTRNDINKISQFTNTVVIEALKSLTSGESYPHDSIDKGIAGNTIVTHLISCGNNSNAHEAYWLDNGVNSRPKTIKETFDYIINNLNSSNIINNFNQENERINDAFDLINCNFNYIRKISSEVLGKKYEDLLSCESSTKSYTFTLGTHLYNVLAQLTLGLDPELIAPYNQEEASQYPDLYIPFNRISGRIETLAGLTDTDVNNVVDGQIIQWSADVNAWVNKDLPNNQTIEEVSDIGDVSDVAAQEGQALIYRAATNLWQPEELNIPAEITSITDIPDVSDVQGAEGQILRLRSDIWTAEDLPSSPTIDNLSDITDVSNSGASEGQVLRYVSNVWTPQDLPADQGSQIEFISELKDVDTTTHAPSNNDLLVWSNSQLDDNSGQPGTWVPKSISQLGFVSNVNLSGSFECTIGGEYERTYPYVNGTYNQIGKQGAPLMFMFKNVYGNASLVKDFTFTCSKMYSGSMTFSFVKFTHAELLQNVYHAISVEFPLVQTNVDPASGEGIGSTENSITQGLQENEYIGLMLNTLEKNSLGVKDEMFHVTIEVLA